MRFYAGLHRCVLRPSRGASSGALALGHAELEELQQALRAKIRLVGDVPRSQWAVQSFLPSGNLIFPKAPRRL